MITEIKKYNFPVFGEVNILNNSGQRYFAINKYIGIFLRSESEINKTDVKNYLKNYLERKLLIDSPEVLAVMSNKRKEKQLEFLTQTLENNGGNK